MGALFLGALFPEAQMREIARRGAEALGFVGVGGAPLVGFEPTLAEGKPAAVTSLLIKCREMLR